MRTTDKILLGVLVLLLVGMGGVMITALDNKDVSLSNRQIILEDITHRNVNYESDDFEELEENEVDVPIIGDPLEMASQAALAYIGEGEVTDSEVGDEEGYYEIEITFGNGNEVDVHLDENFKVLSTEYEDEEED